MPENDDRAAYMREWRTGIGKAAYENAKGQQRARARAMRKLVRNHQQEFNRMYASECVREGVSIPDTTL